MRSRLPKWKKWAECGRACQPGKLLRVFMCVLLAAAAYLHKHQRGSEMQMFTGSTNKRLVTCVCVCIRAGSWELQTHPGLFDGPAATRRVISNCIGNIQQTCQTFAGFSFWLLLLVCYRSLLELSWSLTQLLLKKLIGGCQFWQVFFILTVLCHVQMVFKVMNHWLDALKISQSSGF